MREAPEVHEESIDLQSDLISDADRLLNLTQLPVSAEMIEAAKELTNSISKKLERLMSSVQVLQ
ncbi:hypothetical protein [Microcystis phage Mwe-JY26]